MKKIVGLILLVGCALLAISCSDDRDSNPVLQTPTQFVLNTPAYAASLYDLKSSATLELTCSQPDYGYTAPVVYEVHVSLTGEFKEAVDENTPATYEALPSTYTTARMNVSAPEMAVAISSLSGIAEEENFYTDPIKVFVRLEATVPTGLKPITSNVIELPQVLAYFALPPMVMPEKMYATGSMVGWDWSKAYEMVPVYGTPGKFWRVAYLDGNDDNSASIKFNSAPEWNGSEFGFEGTTINDKAEANVSDDGGNIKVGKAGWYILVVSTEVEGRDYNYTVEILEPKVYLMGDAGGGWDATDKVLFSVPDKADGEFVSPAFVAEQKEDEGIRACILLEGHEWWHTEFMVLDEKLEYRGAGGDQDRRLGSVGQKLYINFTAGTGSVK